MLGIETDTYEFKIDLIVWKSKETIQNNEPFIRLK